MRRIKELTSALFDPMVVVIVMTVLGLIIGVLALWVALYGPAAAISNKIAGLCFLIGLFGLITIILQVRMNLRRAYARERLAELYREGREVITGSLIGAPDSLDRLGIWTRDTKEFLPKYLGDSYLIRFESAGTSQADVLLDFLKEIS